MVWGRQPMVFATVIYMDIEVIQIDGGLMGKRR